MGSFSIWHWLVVLVIVALVFGTKKLRNIGEDMGSAIKSFRKGMQEGDDAKLRTQGRSAGVAAIDWRNRQGSRKH